MEPLRVGVVGVGGMGGQHVQQAHEAIDEVRLTALCDVNEDVLARQSRQYGLAAFADYRALVDSGLCEAVLIATPHPFHAAAAIYAAQRGLHVLCEKPLAVTVSEADAMVEAARAHGVLLGVMFQERTRPVYRTAHRLLAEGTIGPLYRSVLIASHWFRSQPYFDRAGWRGTWQGEGGGVVMNQAPHSLDLFIWLGGMPRQLVAQAFTRALAIEVEDTVGALLDYGHGHSGYLYTTTAQWPGQSSMTFSGDGGQLVIQDDHLRLYRLDRPLPESLRAAPPFELPAGAWEDVPLDDTGQAGHVEVLRRFAHAVREGTPLVADGSDGLRSLELANALLLSGYNGQPVALPLDRAAYDAFLAERHAGAK